MEAENAQDLDDVLRELKKLNDDYETRLNISGMRVYKTKEDGNCLFRALSILYFGDEKYHFILRYNFIVEKIANCPTPTTI